MRAALEAKEQTATISRPCCSWNKVEKCVAEFTADRAVGASVAYRARTWVTSVTFSEAL